MTSLNPSHVAAYGRFAAVGSGWQHFYSRVNGGAVGGKPGAHGVAHVSLDLPRYFAGDGAQGAGQMDGGYWVGLAQHFEGGAQGEVEGDYCWLNHGCLRALHGLSMTDANDIFSVSYAGSSR